MNSIPAVPTNLKPPNRPSEFPPRVRSADLSVAQLHTFRDVMREGGYAAASKVSHLSVPSVWQHIQALEKAYRVKLFARVGRRVEPTDAARRLYEQVDGILESLDSTFDVALNEPRHRAIRLVTGVRMWLEDLTNPIAKFQRRRRIPLVIRHGNEQRAEDLLLRDEADLALTLEPGLRGGSTQIHYEPAYTVEFLAVAKKSHPYAHAKSASLAELARHELIVTGTGSHGRDALDQAFYREGLQANIAIETDNSAFTIACVAGGMGVGVLAGRSDGALCKRLVTRSLSKQLGRRKIVFMWRKGRLLSEPMIELIETVKQLDL